MNNGKADGPGAARLAAGAVGIYLKPGGMLLLALPIVNSGQALASKVQVDAVTMAGVKRVVPATLPVALGDIGAQGQVVVDAVFEDKTLVPGATYQAQVEGHYAAEDRHMRFVLTYSCVIPASAPGRGLARTARSTAHRIGKGAGFARQHSQARLFEADSGTRIPVPTDPFPDATQKRRARTQETKIVAARRVDPKNANRDDDAALAFAQRGVLRPQLDPVNIFTDMPAVQTGWLTAEPSGAVDSSGNVVLMTGNFFAAFSGNGGQDFTILDPDAIFPALPQGWCDQVVRYAPGVDRFVWVRMYGTITGGVLRVATATPADIVQNQGLAGWTYWDITGQSVGVTSVDYPDLSIGDNYLYLSYNSGGPAVIRMPLSQIDGSKGYVDFDFTDPGLISGQSHLSQSTADEVFWAVNGSNTSMRVFSWKESDGLNYSWRDVTVGSWPNSHPSSQTPDGQDWLNSCASGNMLGLTRRIHSDGEVQHNEVWFAWTAASGNGFEQAHIEVVVLDLNDNFKLISQEQIWTNDNAYAYPALCTNANGEVGLSLEAGGGPGGWENHVVGFWGDGTLYVTTGSNVGCTRYGDYVTICQDAQDPAKFVAFGYGVMSGNPPPNFGSDVAGVLADIRYVSFGR